MIKCLRKMKNELIMKELNIFQEKKQVMQYNRNRIKLKLKSDVVRRIIKNPRF